MQRFVLLLTVFAATGCTSTPAAGPSSSPAPTIDDLAWLAGQWIRETPESTSEELWMKPGGGHAMLGLNRTVADGRMIAFEFLRIEQDGDGIVYLASPGGRDPPTPFRMIELDGQRVVFENPAHDFPQRVIYARRGAMLHARIEGGAGRDVRSIDWAYRRTGDAVPIGR